MTGSASLTMPAEMFQSLNLHLLANTSTEKGAFVFASPTRDGTRLKAENVWLLRADDFRAQRFSYLELADDVLPEVIKRAHDGGFAVVEFHSHLRDHPACFSWTDRQGLREVVPHVRWRLRGAPYMALVVSPSSFDGLCWLEHDPETILSWEVDGVHHCPTGLSLDVWRKDEDGEESI